jgi:SET domain-containing protein
MRAVGAATSANTLYCQNILRESSFLLRLIIRSSDIHAAGCFAVESIPKGTRVLEYTGERISKAEGDNRYDGRPFTYLFGIGDGQVVIDGHGMAMFVNHSCDPNCETDEQDGRVYIVTLRDVASGEELTYDYWLYDGEEAAPCFCGSRNCRGTMYSPQELKRQQRAQAKKNKPSRVGGKNRSRK